MKSYSIFLVIVLSVVSLSFVAWVGQPKKPDATTPPAPTSEDLPLPSSGPYGKAEVTETEFDFGTGNMGEMDSHQFKLKNVGEGPLEFLLGKTSCQCTVGDIVKENGEVLKDKDDTKVNRGTLAPGESMHLRVEWAMKMVNEKFRQTVPVFTTDPDNRQVVFVISGAITQLYDMTPEGVWSVGEMLQNEPSKIEGYFYSSSLEEFTLTEEPHPNNKLKVTIEPIDLAKAPPTKPVKSGYKIMVEVPNERVAGRFRESFKVKATSSKGDKEQEIAIIGNKAGPIDLRGINGAGYDSATDRIIFRDIPAAVGAKATMTLFVKGFSGVLKVEGVEPENSLVKFTLLDSGTKLGNSKAYKGQIEILPGPPEVHRYQDAIPLTIKLNHPDIPELKLLVDYNAIR